MTVKETLNRLSAAFRVKLTGDEAVEWADAMGGATDNELNIAAAKLIRESKFMPRPADMWDVIDRMRVDNAPAPEPVVEHWNNRTYRCHGCEDTGLRTVWHPKAMRGAVRFVRGEINERAWRGTLASCVVKCDCEKGKARRLTKETKHDLGELTYKPDIMIDVDKNSSPTQQVESLLQWAKFYEDPRPANYVQAFEDFD